MRYTGIIAAAALAAIAVAAGAQADTVSPSGSIAAFCGVTVSNQAFNLNSLVQQRVADLNVKCNNKVNPHLTVAAANGTLKNGAFSIPYSFGLDLAGPINSVQTSQINGSTVPTNINLISGSELALGVPGDMTMVVKGTPWAAGTYSETFTLTVG